MNKKYLDLIIAFILVAIAVSTRTIFHIGPNVELVTFSTLAGGYFLTNKKLALLLPIIIMLISDSIIGNTSIFLFTWSAFFITPILGILLRSPFIKHKFKDLPDIFRPSVLGLAGTTLSIIIFYLWTNFGVVVTTAMYPDTFGGLLSSYFNALPFLKNQLFGNLIFTPILFAGFQLFFSKKANENIDRKQVSERDIVYIEGGTV